MFLPKVEQIHFIGIGGYGMSALAEVLLQRGYRVTGSDLNESSLVRHLVERGAEIKLFHHPDHISSSELVVHSTAIPADNVELLEARRRNVPVWHRSEMLAALLNSTYGIAVAGTHGKTTVSTMIALLLEAGGLDPTALIGGEVAAFGSNARYGHGKYLVAEACESDHSFLRYLPQMAVVTNVEADHLEHYQNDFGLMQQAYHSFLKNLPGDGCAVLCSDDPFLKGLAAQLGCRVVTYGLRGGADYSGSQIGFNGTGAEFTFCRGGEPVTGTITMQVPGEHNVNNALAALAVAVELGLDPVQCAGALKEFQGTRRRFEIIGRVNGVTIVDDYAHHPTEVKVTLKAAKAAAGRVCCIFQPHRYSRTAYFFEKFATSFGDAELILLHRIYSAGEKPIEGISAAALAKKIGEVRGGAVYSSEDMAELGRRALAWARPGDMIVVMGAGDITALAHQMGEE